MPPISLLLWMLKWITINFTCASQQEPCTNPLCQTQHIQGSHDICLDRLDGVELVVHGRCGAREVVDPVDLEKDGLDNIVAEQLEPGVPQVVRDVLLPACEEVVHHDHAIPLLQQPVDEVAAHEARPAGDDDAARRRAEARGDPGGGRVRDKGEYGAVVYDARG